MTSTEIILACTLGPITYIICGIIGGAFVTPVICNKYHIDDDKGTEAAWGILWPVGLAMLIAVSILWLFYNLVLRVPLYIGKKVSQWTHSKWLYEPANQNIWKKK